MNDLSTPRVLAMLGPTNTGKTHYAIERMAAHPDGVIGLPLRLLAREVYDRLVALKPAGQVALITGEEKIIAPGARWFVCTVESMPDAPLHAPQFSFAAIDEIQLIADAERGHVFTDRLLRLRGRFETLFLGSDAAKPVLRALVPGIEFLERPRLSNLSYAGSKKLSRLARRSAVVAFSAEEVYRIAEGLRRHKGGAAVVLGALSPRTRNAQVALYQAGEVDYLVATDAIGMGLNMDIDHMAFAGQSKFDGIVTRTLIPAEIGQIAGRAGRHMRDGTFGVTESVTPFEPALVERIENHRYEPLGFARWRNADLDMRTPARLLASLEAPPPHKLLVKAREADDLLSLKSLLALPDIADEARQGGTALALLWDVCQTPDFRKTMHESHVRLLAQIYRYLRAHGELPEEWVAQQLTHLDRTEGDIDTLSARIAHVRTWTFIAHRAGWLREPGPWQLRARFIEDRLSDALHDRLTQRFVERRALYRPGGIRDFAVRLDAGGMVMIDDARAGELRGLCLHLDGKSAPLSGRLERALAPILRRQAKRMTDSEETAFNLREDGTIEWNGDLVARLTLGANPLRPKVRLAASEGLEAESRTQVEARIQAWLDAYLKETLTPLYALDLDEAELSAAARGLVYQWREAMGHLGRKTMASYISGLTPDDRRNLRKAGLRLGALALYAPALMKPKAQRLLALLWCIKEGVNSLPALAEGRMAHDAASHQAPFGWWQVQGYHLFKTPETAKWLRADRTDDVAVLMLTAAKAGPFALDPAWASRLGAGIGYLDAIARALDLKPQPPAEGAGENAPLLYGWAKRGQARPEPGPKRHGKNQPKEIDRPNLDSPFAALAGLKKSLGK